MLAKRVSVYQLFFLSKERLKGGEEIILEGSGKKGVSAERCRVNWIQHHKKREGKR